MPPDQPGARLGYRGSAMSRARQIAVKSLLIIGGALMLASAFVLSLVFLAIGLVVVLIGGGYLWWQTRELRKQLRARMEANSQPRPGGRIIDGEVVSGDRPDDHHRE